MFVQMLKVVSFCLENAARKESDFCESTILISSPWGLPDKLFSVTAVQSDALETSGILGNV